MLTLLPVWFLACSDKDSAAEDVELPRSNVPPVVVLLELEPETPRADDEIVALWEVLDIDEDPVEVWFEWSADGVVIYDEGDTLPAGEALGGQTITVELTLADGYAFGVPEQASVYLENSAPTVSGVTITPSGATATDVLSCEYEASDADGDPITPRFTWLINGAETSSRIDNLSSGYARGDTVICEVTVSDGAADSAPASGQIQIANSPPEAPEIALDPDPASPCTSGGVVISAGSFDVDGDEITYEVSWVDDGGSEVFSGADYPGFTFEDGRDYTVFVTPHDGTDRGPAAALGFRARGGGESLGDGLDQDCDGQVDEWLGGAWQAQAMYWETEDGAQAGNTVGAGDLDGDGLDELVIARAGRSDLLIFRGASMDPAAPRLEAHDWLVDDASGVLDLDAADADGDGVAELLVGATGYDGGATNAGAVFLLSGDALAAGSGADLDALDSWRIEGDESSMSLGGAVALGDIDGDGLADAAAGEPSEDAPSRDAGAVYVFGAPAGTSTFNTADARLEGTNREALFGSSVAVIGDLDGDGYRELAVGAPGDDTGASEGGLVAVWFGGAGVASGAVADAGLLILGDDNGDMAGATDASAADVDGDGKAELVVVSQGDGAVQLPGTLSLFRGSAVGGGGTFSLAEAFAVVEGDAANGALGVYGGGASLADLGGDGAAELIAGASGEGMLYVWGSDALDVGGALGPADADIAIAQEYSGDQFGRWAVIADTDGDGQGEILSGAYRSSAAAGTGGAAYVFRPDYGEVEYWQPDCDAAAGLLLCRTAATWDEARAHCQRLGGDLARLDGARRNGAAGSAAADRALPGSDRGSWWIGLSDLASEGSWVWLDDAEVAGWDAWAGSEPRSGTDRNCASTNGAGEGEWEASVCAESKPFICDP